MVSVLLQGPQSPISVKEFAELVQLGKLTVDKRVKESNLKVVSNEAGSIKYAFVEMCRAVLSAANAAKNDDGTVDPSKLMPADAKTYWASRKIQISVEEKERQLVPALKVEREYAKLVKTLVQALDTLPDTIEREVGLTPEAVAKMHGLISNCREQLVNAIFSHEEVREE